MKIINFFLSDNFLQNIYSGDLNKKILAHFTLNSTICQNYPIIQFKISFKEKYILKIFKKFKHYLPMLMLIYLFACKNFFTFKNNI